MATAPKKARATTGDRRSAMDDSESASMEFVIVEDNGGDFHWTLLDRDGTSLARSATFASYEHTEDAARVVHAGVGSARLDRRAAVDSLVGTRD